MAVRQLSPAADDGAELRHRQVLDFIVARDHAQAPKGTVRNAASWKASVRQRLAGEHGPRIDQLIAKHPDAEPAQIVALLEQPPPRSLEMEQAASIGAALAKAGEPPSELEAWCAGRPPDEQETARSAYTEGLRAGPAPVVRTDDGPANVTSLASYLGDATGPAADTLRRHRSGSANRPTSHLADELDMQVIRHDALPGA